MTDRELLELAARAAGYDTSHKWNAERLSFDPPVIALCIPGVSTGWNPLTDDGDALRLAVACCISFGIGSDTGRMRVAYFVGSDLHMLDMPEDHPMALHASEVEWLRRAIVRAAAQIQLNKEAANE